MDQKVIDQLLILISISNIKINYTKIKLTSGLRWKKLQTSQNIWIGVMDHRVWKIWRIDPSTIGFEVLYDFYNDMQFENTAHVVEPPTKILHDFFQVYLDCLFYPS